MKFFNFNKVLCLSPHPDDVEYSMSGTILKYRDTHFDILCLTEGGDCDVTTSKNRIQEVKNSWGVTNAKNYSLHFSGYKFIKELEEEFWVNFIEEKLLYKQNYDCIFTTSNCDSHFEHKIVNNISLPLTRSLPISLIEYYSPSTLQNWIPNLYVDIIDEFNIKLKMLKQFKSQQHRPYFKKNTIEAFHTNFLSHKKGKEKVELFKIKNIING